MGIARGAPLIPPLHPQSLRWVVAAPGSRDGYQVPLALHEAGLLECLVTDLYAGPESLVHRFAERCRPSLLRKLDRRFSPGIPDSMVRSVWPAAIASAIAPTQWRRYAEWIGKAAARSANAHDSGVIAYAHVATSAFSRAAGPKVLVQMQAHPKAVKTALASDRLTVPFPIQNAEELSWSTQVFERYSREPLLADLCIAPSEYVRCGLIDNGVPAEKAVIVRYGVDLEFFSPAEQPSDVFTVSFVGKWNRQKGIHYLLEAWKQLALPRAELRLAGVDTKIASEYAPNCTVLGRLSKLELREEYRRADLLCLPSLAEAFGHAALEALACGTPVLVTDNCGVAEHVRDGANGFILPAANVSALSERLRWAAENRTGLRAMRASARRTAEEHAWERYRKEIVEVVQVL